MNKREIMDEIESIRTHLNGSLDRLRALEILLDPALPDSPEQVLVADDDPIHLKVVSRMLATLGYDCVVVGSGHEALAQLEASRFKLVLLDVEMPDLDGLETARRIRSRCYPSPYIIALTAGSAASTRRSVMEAGMQDYLAKPLRIEDLKDALLQVP
jgi:CheY-like chemotaxis protein